MRTYDVVPITPSLGMVAFVAGTTPLKALLTDPALIPGEAIAAADEKYSRFIMAKGGNLDRAGLLALLHFVTCQIGCLPPRLSCLFVFTYGQMQLVLSPCLPYQRCWSRPLRGF